jgi:cellobiose-specific phosphotransferase system component IIA
MNYIRFWQAAGESEKTSIRTKTRMSQIVQDGCFRGGGVPYGYRLEKQGRKNKANHEVNEIVIDEVESPVVRSIFDLYVNKGYGSQRIATYLREQGIKNRSGKNFVNCTIANMLKNKSYIGILKSGETESEIFDHLQIIDERTFETAQNIFQQRSRSYKDRCVPLNTKGSSLLSGRVFCGHCGSRLTVTTNGKRYIRKDGVVTTTPRTRYLCYNKTRYPGECDGQSGYTVRKLDAIIEKLLQGLFRNFCDLPKDALVTSRYAEKIAGYRKQLDGAKADYQSYLSETEQYEAEVLKAIRGESQFNPDLLNKLYEEAKSKTDEAFQVIGRLEKQISDGEQMKLSLSEQFEEIRSWADIYDDIDMDAKKMILSRIMKKVSVSRDYEIEVEFTVNFEQMGGHEFLITSHQYDEREKSA